jgi:hypothetical protein
MKILFIIASLVLIMPVNTIVAQKNYAKEVENLKYAASNYFKKGMYDEALPNYMQITVFQPDNNMAFLDAGICHLYSSKPKKEAIGIIKNSLRNVANGVDQYYYLARAYHLSGDYEKAISTYKIFLSRYPKQDNWRETVILNIKQAYNAILFLKKSTTQISVENVGDSINTFNDEFSYMMIQAKQQLLISRSFAKLGYEDLFYNSGNYYLKNVETKFAKYRGGFWAESVFDSILISNSNYLTSKANYMFHFTTEYNADNDLDINLARFKNNQIDSIFTSKIINTKYSDKDAYYCSVDSSIYFASNRPGGYGGFDIYCTKWSAKDSTWSKPMNLGFAVNTPYDEINPFIRDGKVLYFASNNDKSFGGFDLFSFNLKAAQQTQSVNLGLPINSAFNEEKFTLSDDGFTAYFVSDRDGGYGYKDIYAAYYIIPNASFKISSLPDLTYAFKLLPEKKIRNNSNIISQNNISKSNTLEVKKVETKQKEKEKSEPIVKKEKPKTEKPKENTSNSQKTNNVVQSTKISALEIFPLRIDAKGRIEKQSEILIEKVVNILKNNPSVRLEVQAHAFLADDPKMNLYKSIEFCKTIRDKFKEFGSSGTRISYNCYGSQYPVKAVKPNENDISINNRVNFILHDIDEKQVQVTYVDDKNLKTEDKVTAYNKLIEKTSDKNYKVEIILLEKTGFLNYRVGNEEVCCQILRDGKLRFLTGFYPTKEDAKEKNDYVKMKGFVNAVSIPFQYGFETGN